MTIQFEHPIGAEADTKELEYVAALLQTGKRVRADATVDSEDIYYYLKSRHGLKVSRRYIEDHLLPELAGNIHQIPFSSKSKSSQKASVEKKNNSSSNAVPLISSVTGSNTLDKEDCEKDGNEGQIDQEQQRSGDNSHSSKSVSFHSSVDRANDDNLEDQHTDLENESFMDLCQVLSIILIPFFVQTSNSSVKQEDHDQSNDIPSGNKQQHVFDKVLETVLTDAFGVEFYDRYFGGDLDDDDDFDTRYRGRNNEIDNNSVSHSELRLTKDLLRDILETYGEIAVPDKILTEMLSLAGGDGCVLTQQTLIQAMSTDVKSYDLSWSRSMSTHYQDILGTKKTTDFWFMEATKRVGGEISEGSKLIGKEITKHGKTFGQGIMRHDSDHSQGRTSSNGKPDSVAISVQEDSVSHVKGDSVPPVTKLNERRDSSSSVNDTSKLDQHDAWYKEIYTAPSIDGTAESFRSQVYTIALWLTVVVGFFAYFFTFQSPIGQLGCTQVAEAGNSAEVTKAFFCQVGQSTVNWIIKFLSLSIFGSLAVFFGSFGTTDSDSIFALLVGMVAVTFLLVLPSCVEVETIFFDTTEKDGWRPVYLFTLVVGCLLLFVQFLLLLQLVLPGTCFSWYQRATIWNGMAKKEARTKAASIFKINRLIDHAMDLHHDELPTRDNVAETRSRSAGASSRGGTAYLNASSRALINYQRLESYRGQSGGILWAWKRIFDQSIFREEGIWFHTRLITSNFFQVVVVFMVFFVVAYFVVYTVRIVDPPDPQYPTISPSEAPSVDGASAAPSSYLSEEDAIPERWQLELSIFLGGVASFLAAVFVSAVYLPSAISTTLKFRYGEIPSLGNRTFQKYREAVDLVSMMFGSMFWGCAVTAAATFFFFGGIVFAFAWHVTRRAAAAAAATIIGFSLTLGIKVAVLSIFRHYFYCGMYRRKVASANIMGLVLDCWYLGLSVGYMAVRALILLAVSAIFVGRVDTPVLAEGVGYLGPVILDSYPITFRKDILLHEAHRHPYIERLGAMYLMKIRFGNEFSSRAGAMWRLLFVLALFPWLRKYRFPQLPALPDEVDVNFALSDSELMEEGCVGELIDSKDPDTGTGSDEMEPRSTKLETSEDDDKIKVTSGLDVDDDDNGSGKSGPNALESLLSFLPGFGRPLQDTKERTSGSINVKVPHANADSMQSNRASIFSSIQDTLVDVASEVVTGGPSERNAGVDRSKRRSVNVRFAEETTISRRSKGPLRSNSRRSLADTFAAEGKRNRDVLIGLENESLKKQVLRLQEQLDALRFEQRERKKDK